MTKTIQSLLILASLTTSVITETCPSDVSPGEWYASPNQVWSLGRQKDRCDTANFEAVSFADIPADTDAACATDRCYFAPNIKIGGHYCPTDRSECGGEDYVQSIADDDECLDTENCTTTWGICRCVQCPCANPDRFGTGCNLCPIPDCDETCQQEGALRTGVTKQCRLGETFYSGFYYFMFPDQFGSPMLKFSIVERNGETEVDFVLYYNLCNEVETVLLASTFKQCSYGMKESCVARDIPTPCMVCEVAGDSYMPENSYLVGTPSETLFRSVDTAGLLYGCTAAGTCEYYLQAIPIDLGTLYCEHGSTCVDDTSSIGQSVTAVEKEDDLAANSNYVWQLISVVAGIFLLWGLAVLAAALYRFKSKPDPRPLESNVLAWKNVHFNNIISGHTGSVKPGQFIAILGSVGAGKSTLLKVLAGRWKATSGETFLNGHKVTSSQLKKVVGFVPQDPVCSARDTVAEAIAFAASMCGGTFPDTGPLTDKLHSRIGTLSGGQRRLVDIYVELARRPAVLLLDEPTTGLDSDTAMVLGRVLKTISQQIPVMITIHQPRPDFAALFTDALVFHEGYQALGVGLSFGDASPTEGLTKVCRKAVDTPVYKSSAFDVAVELVMEGQIRHSTKTEGKESKLEEEPGPQPRKANLWRCTSVFKQIAFLSIRNTKRALRFGIWKYFVTLIIALVLGGAFYQSGADSRGLADRFSAIFLVQCYFAVQGVSAVGEQLEIHALTEHEIASGVYARPINAMVRVLSQVAGQLPHALIMVVVVFPMVGLQEGQGRPVIFGLSIMAVAVAAACSALACRGRTTKIGGIMAAAALNGAMCIFCGAFTDTDEMPWLVDAVLYFSPFRYSFEALVARDFIGLKVVVPLDYEYEGTKNSVTITASGEYYLDSFSLPTSLGPDLDDKNKMVAVCAAVWFVVAWVALSWPTRLTPMRTRSLKREVDSSVSVSRLSRAIGMEQDHIRGVETDRRSPHRTPCMSETPSQSEGSKSKIQDEGITVIGNEAGGVCRNYEEILQNVSPVKPLQPPVAPPEVPEVELSKVSELIWSSIANPDVKNVSGGVKTGQILGIVGPCGSGKTTLLKMLAGRIKPTKGSITINGQVLSINKLRELVGFVPQEDCVCGEDSVGEALAFAEGGGVEKQAQALRNSLVAGTVSQDTKELSQLLGHLSQGQRRLATVCAELARRPRVILLDEPTSGLDTVSSMKLIQLLKGVSLRMPVVMTLHQPRVEIQNLLTDVLVMRKGEPAIFMPYPDLRSIVLPMAANAANAANPLMAQANPLMGNARSQIVTVKLGMDAQTAVEEDMAITTLDFTIERLDEFKDEKYVLPYIATQGLSPPRREKEREPGLAIAKGLIVRAFRRTWLRQPQQRAASLVCWIFAGFFLGMAMTNQMKMTMEGMTARAGMFAVINVVIGMLAVPSIYEFDSAKVNIKHELETQVGSPVLYHFCLMSVTLVERLVLSILFSIVFMVWVPINEGFGRRIVFILAVFLSTLGVTFLATGLAALFNHNNAVNSYNGLLVFMFVATVALSSVDPTQDIPSTTDLMGVAKWFSFFHPVLEVEMANELVGLSGITANFASMEVATFTGTEILVSLGFRDRFGTDLWIIIAWIMFFAILGAFGLTMQTRPSRRAARAQ